jgi:hypothetical protein
MYLRRFSAAAAMFAAVAGSAGLGPFINREPTRANNAAWKHVQALRKRKAAPPQIRNNARECDRRRNQIKRGALKPQSRGI